jgi:hypothetical protein
MILWLAVMLREVFCLMSEEGAMDESLLVGVLVESAR